MYLIRQDDGIDFTLWRATFCASLSVNVFKRYELESKCLVWNRNRLKQMTFGLVYFHFFINLFIFLKILSASLYGE